MKDSVAQNARILWDYHRLGMPVEPADAIVGLGSYDLRVADRCAELWKAGTAGLIVFSGARGNWTRGLDQTEAALFTSRALSLGVPDQAVLQEDRSTNLGQNVALTRDLLERQGRPRGRLLLVTKPNTERRALATALKVWPEARWRVTSPGTRLEGPYAAGRSFDDLADEMAGDLERILKYPELGFQVEQEVPSAVLDAFEALKAAGYVRHLMKP
jgi:uncharacterized SAM-binding protein YcdF (DUF218 family)